MARCMRTQYMSMAAALQSDVACVASCSAALLVHNWLSQAQQHNTYTQESNQVAYGNGRLLKYNPDSACGHLTQVMSTQSSKTSDSPDYHSACGCRTHSNSDHLQHTSGGLTTPRRP